jgi:hypothetical protein
MKKIIGGMLMLMLISGGIALAAEKNKPAKKAPVKKECKASDCTDKKECKDKTACSKVCKPVSC